MLEVDEDEGEIALECSALGVFEVPSQVFQKVKTMRME